MSDRNLRKKAMKFASVAAREIVNKTRRAEADPWTEEFRYHDVRFEIYYDELARINTERARKKKRQI